MNDSKGNDQTLHACLIGNCKETFLSWNQTKSHILTECKRLSKLSAERNDERKQESMAKASKIHGAAMGKAFACLADKCLSKFNNWSDVGSHLGKCAIVRAKNLHKHKGESIAKAKLMKL